MDFWGQGGLGAGGEGETLGDRVGFWGQGGVLETGWGSGDTVSLRGLLVGSWGLELRDDFLGVPGGLRGGVAPLPFTRLSPDNRKL